MYIFIINNVKREGIWCFDTLFMVFFSSTCLLYCYVIIYHTRSKFKVLKIPKKAKLSKFSNSEKNMSKLLSTTFQWHDYYFRTDNFI